MKLVVVAIGRLKAGPERALCERYHERLTALARSAGFTEIKLIERGESAGRRPEERKAEEARVLLAEVPPGARLIVCDETGEEWDSAGFARRLRLWREAGTSATVVIIGGADGLDPAIAARADVSLAFGRMTLPHQLVRVLVLEQLYRAATILTGHPYHRA